jgi:hypothetical protein
MDTLAVKNRIIPNRNTHAHTRLTARISRRPVSREREVATSPAVLSVTGGPLVE